MINPQITLRQLRFLAALAETLNFSRAAELCHVTQPTLSAGLRELEERLGVQLAERNTRSVILTPLGAEIAGRARALLLAAVEPPLSRVDRAATLEPLQQEPFEALLAFRVLGLLQWVRVLQLRLAPRPLPLVALPRVLRVSVLVARRQESALSQT